MIPNLHTCLPFPQLIRINRWSLPNINCLRKINSPKLIKLCYNLFRLLIRIIQWGKDSIKTSFPNKYWIIRFHRIFMNRVMIITCRLIISRSRINSSTRRGIKWYRTSFRISRSAWFPLIMITFIRESIRVLVWRGLRISYISIIRSRIRRWLTPRTSQKI